MSRRKRKKINRIKLLLIIIIVFGIFIYIKKSKNNDNYTSGDDNVDNIKYDILDKSESDKDIVEKYFMDGMKKSDYERVLNHNNRLISDNNYKYIDYDFDGKLHYSELETLFKKVELGILVPLFFEIIVLFVVEFLKFCFLTFSYFIQFLYILSCFDSLFCSFLIFFLE